MGCCLSHGKTVEVTLDADGKAYPVPKGQGTHFIYTSEDAEIHMEEKPQNDELDTESDKTHWYSTKVAPIATE